MLPSRVFITGSSDGPGPVAGRLLAGQGHQVTLHVIAAGVELAPVELARVQLAGAGRPE